MKRIAKTFIAGVVAVSMCVSPIGVIVNCTPCQGHFELVQCLVLNCTPCQGEGGLNSKAKVQDTDGSVEVSFGDGLGGDLEIPMEESVEGYEVLHILKNRD